MIYTGREKAEGSASSKISFWAGDADGASICKKWSGRIAAGTVNSRETISTRRYLPGSFPSRSPLRDGFSVPAWITTSAAPATAPRPLGAAGMKVSRDFLPSSVPFRRLSVLSTESYRFVCVFPSKEARRGFGADGRHINRRRSLNFESLLNVYRRLLCPM